MPAREELQELAALGEAPLAHVEVARHLLDEAEKLARPEVELPVEARDRGEDLLARKMGIAEHARLRAARVDQIRRLEPALLLCLAVERGAGIRRRQRDLERIGIDVVREADRLLDRLAGLAGEPHDERAVDLDPERLRLAREPARDVQANPLLHTVQDLLAA